eukprot:10936040-Alexandrium_andersonii.AAC.1
MQWILRQVNKYGRDKGEAAEEWNHLEATGTYRKDNFGHKNSLRMWLPKNEYIDKNTTRYINGETKESSDRKKSASAQYTNALKQHAHDMFAAPHGVTHGHAFFSGQCASSSADGQ